MISMRARFVLERVSGRAVLAEHPNWDNSNDFNGAGFRLFRLMARARILGKTADRGGRA
jgi:hypothetical protein